MKTVPREIRMNMLNRLGVAKRFSQEWTPAEVKLLSDNYRSKGWKWCAAELKRSKGAVLGKANAIGIAGRWVLVYDEPKDDTNEV